MGGINVTGWIRFWMAVIFYLPAICFAQVTVYNNARISVNLQENVYIQGHFVNQGGASYSGNLDINGTIHLTGNWTNNHTSSSIVNNSSNGLVRLIGTTQQVMGGVSPTNFTSVELDNLQGVSLLKDEEIRQVFTFTNGKVFTNSSFLIVSNTATSSMVGYDLNKYVVGNLRRYMTGTTQYDFPVGNFNYLELAQLNFQSVTGMNYVDAWFVTGSQPPPPQHPASGAVYIYPNVMNPVDPMANPSIGYTYISEFLDQGYWNLNTNSGASSPIFNLTLTERGHTNGGMIPNLHAIVRRDDAVSAWGAQGIYTLSQQSGTGTNPVTSVMEKMTNFGHFIIGNSNNFGPLSIELVDFQAVCDNGLVKLTWTTSNEDNNSYFTVQRSTDLQTWQEVGRVAGQAVSHGNITYQLYDEIPNTQTTYYRLSQTDLDGTTKIFQNNWIRYADCGDHSSSWVNFVPMPENYLQFDFFSTGDGPYSIRAFDITGRLLTEYKESGHKGMNSGNIKIPCSAPAVVLLQLTSATLNTSHKTGILR